MRIFLLTTIILVLAMTVVELRHHNRLRYAELQILQNQRDELNIEWGKLLLEEGTWSQHNRIENLARARLGMVLPRPEQMVVVTLPEGKDK